MCFVVCGFCLPVKNSEADATGNTKYKKYSLFIPTNGIFDCIYLRNSQP